METDSLEATVLLSGPLSVPLISCTYIDQLCEGRARPNGLGSEGSGRDGSSPGDHRSQASISSTGSFRSLQTLEHCRSSCASTEKRSAIIPCSETSLDNQKPHRGGIREQNVEREPDHVLVAGELRVRPS